MVGSPTGLGPENECAGEVQQQLKMTDTSYRERGYYRIVTAGVQLRKRILAVNLKGNLQS
jgi:hypothetical protein